MDEGAQDCGFDAVITDDGILDHILFYLEPQDVLNLSFVNKRWKNVALYGPQHTPIPLCLQQLFQTKPGTSGASPSRFHAYCALCAFNLLEDPFFLVQNPRFPINVFKECPWVTTVAGGSSKHYNISPSNELPGKLGNVDALLNMPYPWQSRFKSTSESPHRVLCSTAKNLMEWTQLIDIQKALKSRGLDENLATSVIDTCPALSFSIFTSMRCPCDASVEVAMLGHKKAVAPYNTKNLDAYSTHALHMEHYNISGAPLDTWLRHDFSVSGYPKGVRNILVSLRACKQGDPTGVSDSCLFGSPCLTFSSSDMSTPLPDKQDNS